MPTHVIETTPGRIREIQFSMPWPKSTSVAERNGKIDQIRGRVENCRFVKLKLRNIQSAALRCQINHPFESTHALLEIDPASGARIDVCGTSVAPIELKQLADTIKQVIGPDFTQMKLDMTLTRLVSSFYIDALSLGNHRLRRRSSTVMLLGVDDVREPGMSVEEFADIEGEVATISQMENGVLIECHQRLIESGSAIAALSGPLGLIEFLPLATARDEIGSSPSQRQAWWQPNVVWKKFVRELPKTGFFDERACGFRSPTGVGERGASV